MDQNKTRNSISWIIVCLLLIYMGFTQRINKEVQESLEAQAQVVVARYELEEVYKAQGRMFVDKYVIDTSYDGVRINTYYKNKDNEVFVDFSDLKLNKRYLMRVTSRDTKDRRATYHMDNSLLLNTKNLIDTVKDKENLGAYTCFYVEDYIVKNTEGLEKLSKSVMNDFDDYLDKEFVEESKETEETIEETEEAESEALKEA